MQMAGVSPTEKPLWHHNRGQCAKGGAIPLGAPMEFWNKLFCFSSGEVGEGFTETHLESQRGTFYLLIHLTNSCNNRGWARPKPGAWNSYLVLPHGSS